MEYKGKKADSPTVCRAALSLTGVLKISLSEIILIFKGNVNLFAVILLLCVKVCRFGKLLLLFTSGKLLLPSFRIELGELFPIIL
jgi:hypothetical protein